MLIWKKFSKDNLIGSTELFLFNSHELLSIVFLVKHLLLRTLLCAIKGRTSLSYDVDLSRVYCLFIFTGFLKEFVIYLLLFYYLSSLMPPSKHTTSFRHPTYNNVKTTSYGCQNNVVCVLGYYHTAFPRSIPHSKYKKDVFEMSI